MVNLKLEDLNMFEIIKLRKQLEEKLKEANYLVKVNSRTRYKRSCKLERDRVLKQLKYIDEYVIHYPKLALIDKSSYSIRSNSKRTKGKPRYLKENGKVLNSMNFALVLCLWNNQAYYINEPNVQLTSKEVRCAYKYLLGEYGNIILATDKRHNCAYKLDKKYTLAIKRYLSRIKKRVYSKLPRDLNMLTKEKLLDIYKQVFNELNIKEIPLS
jgi:hypothetical protein